jgi:hypothetical protein
VDWRGNYDASGSSCDVSICCCLTGIVRVDQTGYSITMSGRVRGNCNGQTSFYGTGTLSSLYTSTVSITVSGTRFTVSKTGSQVTVTNQFVSSCSGSASLIVPSSCSSTTQSNAFWPTTSLSGTAYGTCNSGYAGSPTRVCGSDGVWGSISGSCIPTSGGGGGSTVDWRGNYDASGSSCDVSICCCLTGTVRVDQTGYSITMSGQVRGNCNGQTSFYGTGTLSSLDATTVSITVSGTRFTVSKAGSQVTVTNELVSSCSGSASLIDNLSAPLDIIIIGASVGGLVLSVVMIVVVIVVCKRKRRQKRTLSSYAVELSTTTLTQAGATPSADAIHPGTPTYTSQLADLSPNSSGQSKGVAPTPIASPPHGYAPQGHAPHGYAPQGYAPQGYAPRGYAPQGYAPQGYASQGYAEMVATALLWSPKPAANGAENPAQLQPAPPPNTLSQSG